MSCARPKLPLAMETDGTSSPRSWTHPDESGKVGKRQFLKVSSTLFLLFMTSLTVVQHSHKLWNQLSQRPEAIVTYTHRLKLAPFRRRPHCIIRSLGIRGSTRSLNGQTGYLNPSSHDVSFTAKRVWVSLCDSVIKNSPDFEPNEVQTSSTVHTWRRLCLIPTLNVHGWALIPLVAS